MRSIASRHALSLSLLVLAFTLSTPACKTVSTVPSIKPTPPTVRCKQPKTPPLPATPRAGEWVEWSPPAGAAMPYGAARLSAKAETWIRAAAGTVTKERGLRGTEWRCLDDLEAADAIRQ